MQLVVIGGGAAGFFCAITAARVNPSLDVMLIEKSGKLLSKVRISGGGRCNVTHACFSILEMTGKYPRGGRFVKKAFHRFFTTDTIAWFRQRGVELKAEADGRMFPVSDSSETIISCLLKEADKFGVRIRLNREVKDLRKTGDKWSLTFANGEQEEADRVCIACGGYSKASMFDWLLQTGHHYENPVPSLFTFNIPNNGITRLMGISVPLVKIKIQGTKLEEEGPVLITHWGISGPAALRLSSRGARELAAMAYSFSISINWLPEFSDQRLDALFQEFRTNNGSQKVLSRNGLVLPQRLWEYFCEISGVGPELRWADLPASRQHKLAATVCNMELAVKGKTTFKEEFVTAGGIRLSEIDALTMESKLASGLFFAGEIMDVDGVTGGFNFQHAWTSGWIAGNSLSLPPRIKKTSGSIYV